MQKLGDFKLPEQILSAFQDSDSANKFVQSAISEFRTLSNDSLVSICRQSLEASMLIVSEMGDRIVRVETLMSDLKSELEMVRRQKADVEEKLAQMKLKLEFAKAQGKIEAVNEFKASDAFKTELYDLAVKSYIAGFNHCKEMVGKKFPELDLSGINIEDYDVDEDETSSVGDEDMDEDHPIE